MTLFADEDCVIQLRAPEKNYLVELGLRLYHEELLCFIHLIDCSSLQFDYYFSMSHISHQ